MMRKHPSKWPTIDVLRAKELHMTRGRLYAMIESLHQSLDKNPNGFDHKWSRWIWVDIADCAFNLQDVIFRDILRFRSAIIYRALMVRLTRSPAIVSYFLHQDPLYAKYLCIDQEQPLSVRECSNLGYMIQRSPELRELSLNLPFADGAQELFACIESAIQLKWLSLAEARETHTPTKDLVADLVLGDNGGGGAIIRHLRNPQNQLMFLTLMKMDLNDHHLSALLQVIPTSQVEYLNVSYNCIQVQGMLEFANLFPTMHSLKHVDFCYNAWQKSPFTDVDRNMVGAAVLQGLLANTWIECMHGFECTSQALLLSHYLELNRAGRHALASSPPIPDGLWPVVLARAQQVGKRRYRDVLALDMSGLGSRLDPCGWDASSAVYHLFRNCPTLHSLRS